ncbi:hypothetical protein JL720_3473 [Aureococcus anophagefferens]|nr:hypothetical protein JL720_3473 [Aureococcus anophagefferens]
MPKLHREVRNATAGKPGILAYLSLGLLMVVLTLVRLCRRRRKFSAKQLDAYHDWKKGTAEGKLESKLARMQQKLEGMRSRRKVEEGRDAHERLLKKAEELREVRGREVYGDDWDDPKDGVPIRDLFALSDVEVRTLQTEARNARAVDARAPTGPNGAAKPKKPPPPPGPPPATSKPRKPPPPPGPPPPSAFAPLDGGRAPPRAWPTSRRREAFGDPRRASRGGDGGSAVAQIRDQLGARAAPRQRKPPPPPGPPPRTALPPLSGPPPRNVGVPEAKDGLV